jgi:branched-chain amino acid aminotransferase
MNPVFFNLNDELFPSGTRVLLPGNRAFRYGDGLFETMRLMKGQLKFPELHADRLQRGMKALKIDGYSEMDAWFLKEKTEQLAARNKVKHGRLRLAVYRNGEGFYTPHENSKSYLLELNPLEEPRYYLNEKGLIMDLFTEIPKPINYLSNIKTGNALPYVMAGLFKTQHKLDDVFLLNQKGLLCEASSSNLFIYYQDQLYTPSLTEGCVEGVMRQVIITLARKIGFKVTEAQINPEILYEADEVFLTNAIKGIQWVMGYGVKRYFNTVSKILMDELNKG